MVELIAEPVVRRSSPHRNPDQLPRRVPRQPPSGPTRPITFTPRPGPNPRALAKFLRELRKRTPFEAFPEAGAARWRSPSDCVTQEQAALMVRMTPGWWSQIERGRKTLDMVYIEPIVVAFKLEPVERVLLWKLATGWDPPDLPAHPFVAGPQLADMVDAMEVAGRPAYVSDPAWDVCIANKILTRLFQPLVPGANVMVEALTNPDMIKLLPDWKDQWARPLIGQLKAAQMCASDFYRPRLDAVVDHILATSKAVHKIWHGSPSTLYIHPDGEVRPVRVDGQVRLVRLAATAVPGVDGARLLALTPLKDPTVWQYVAR